MADLIKDGLIITVVGMGLVFAALALLWGIMAAMQRLFPVGANPLAFLARRQQDEGATALVAEFPATGVATEAEVGPTPEELAAIVVALASWRQGEAGEQSAGRRLPALLTSWTAVGRGRQVQSWSPRR